MVEVTLIGSLARGNFRCHSDVDLLVRGSSVPKHRPAVERMVADAMRATKIPYDLFFEDDLTEEQVRKFLDGNV